MLQAIRDRVTGFIAVIILGLLAIPFALVGIQNYFAPDPENIVARVGDDEITVSDFQQSFNQQRRNFQQILGSNFNPAMFEGEVARREYLEQMINGVLLKQFAESGGMDIAPDKLAQTIASFPNFQVAGQFDSQLYRAILSQSRYTPAQFEREQREQLVQTSLMQGLTGSAFATRDETNRFLTLQEESRHIQFFPVAAQPFREGLEISDEDLQQYYDEHPDDYMSEEQVVIDYLELNAIDYAQEVVVSDDTLRDRYEQQKGRFVTPERRLTSHILLTFDNNDAAAEQGVLEQATELAERVRQGEDFAVLAEEFSQDPGSANNGGDLGWVETGVMVAPFEEALFAMDANSYSGPVKSAFGYHVIWLREVDESHGQSFDEVKEELRQEVAEEQARQSYDDIVNRVTTITYEDTGSLQSAADEAEINIKTSPPFGRGGGPGIASYPEVASTAFSDLVLLDGINSDPVQVGTDHIVVMRLNEHLLSKLRPFEEVKESIRSVLANERSSEAAKQLAEAVAARIQTGELEFEAAAVEQAQEVTTMESMTRRDFQLGADFIRAVFGLAAPGEEAPAYHVVPRNGQDWAVLALHSIQAGDPEQAQEASRQQVAQQISSYFSGVEQDYLIAQLRAKAEIQIYEDRL